MLAARLAQERVENFAGVTQWSGVLIGKVNRKCTLTQVYTTTIEDFEARLDQPPRLVKTRYFFEKESRNFLKKKNKEIFSRNSRF